MIINPFKINTQKYNVLEKLKDYKWHCTKCDLEAAQAATFRDMKKEGVIFDSDKNGNEYKKINCLCGKQRVHRKLKE